MPIQAHYKIFRSHYETWDIMAQQVSEFLSTLGPGRVIGVSHSQESQLGVIIVWYWEVEQTPEAQPLPS